MRETAQRLTGALYRFDCPASLVLGEYALDALEPEQRQLVAAHTLECEECTAELSTLRAYLALEPRVPESLGGQVRRVIASLLPTPGAGLAAVGLRGTADASMQVYQAGSARLSLTSGQRSGYLMGLLEDEGDLEGRIVRLVSTTSPDVQETTLDDLGNFELESIAEGTYALEVELADGVAVVERVQVH
jgi:hypothetical protein